MASPYKALNLGEYERMKNCSNLILGEVVYISVIYQIPDSLLYLLNGYDF